MTGTLIYSPAVSMVVDTINDGLIDISEDMISGNLNLRENASHNFSVRFNNGFRKYDGVFAPNDRVVIQLKRMKWLQVFAGYLDRTPLYSTYPRVIELSGQCTMKVFKNWPWDARSERALALIHGATTNERAAQDGGIGAVAARVMTEVVGWPSERIHIGKVPDQWFDKFQKVYSAVKDDALSAAEVLGTNPIIAGRVADSSPTESSEAGVSVDLGNGIDLSYVLLTIRTLESGNNYSAVNRGDGVGDIASGAYQFVTTTWNNYGGYKDAYLAPRAVQDAKAEEYVRYILGRWGNKLVNVPYGWYYPKVFSDQSLLDKTPAANEGNKLTVRQYGEKWVKTYISIYEQGEGKSPVVSPSGDITVVSPTSGQAVVITPANQGQSQSSTDAIYPIPSGVQSLDYQKVAWGGYSNGKIPQSAMKYASGIGFGHPAAVNSLALLIEEGKKHGYDFRGGCYRSYEEQARGAAASGLFATPGRSIHGWGLAMDFSILTSNSSKHSDKTLNEMYDTPEYVWLAANAWRWGWGHPRWAQRGGSKPEPWHWEFFAFENFRNSPEARPGVGFNPSSQGPNPFDGAEGGFSLDNPSTTQLFTAIAWWDYGDNEVIDEESAFLTGIRATMNDTPVFETVRQLIGVANRSFCAAPNGDFIAWFPDYWGEYNMAGRMNVELIELQDFTVDWSDDSLITHQFVEGAQVAKNGGALPSGMRDTVSGMLTSGVATVELPRFLEAVVNIPTSQIHAWLKDPQQLLSRFGARIDRTFVGTISGPQQEFWYATHLFLQAWAGMFRSSVPITFMPELFPGMLLCIPELKVQFYVKGVSHSWDLANDVGFSTQAEVIAPSATDGSGFYMFPKGGVPPVRSVGSRGLFKS